MLPLHNSLTGDSQLYLFLMKKRKKKYTVSYMTGPTPTPRSPNRATISPPRVNTVPPPTDTSPPDLQPPSDPTIPHGTHEAVATALSQMPASGQGLNGICPYPDSAHLSAKKGNFICTYAPKGTNYQPTWPRPLTPDTCGAPTLATNTILTPFNSMLKPPSTMKNSTMTWETLMPITVNSDEIRPQGELRYTPYETSS